MFSSYLEVFNLADQGDTDQGKLVAVLGRLFGIETGFYGSVVSNLMRVSAAEASR